MAHAHRPGVGQAAELVGLVDSGAESPMESKSRLRCVDAGLPRPRTQVQVRTPAGLRRADLGWEGFKVAAEYDSVEHHAGAANPRRDNIRHNALTAAGWMVVYIGAGQVLHRPHEFTDAVRAALLARGWDRRRCRGPQSR